MKVFNYIFFLSFALSSAVTAMEARASNNQQAPKLALVVGNRSYQSLSRGNIERADNDAIAVAETLTSLGFDVTVRLNLGHQQLGAALSNFQSQIISWGRATQRKPVAVFYFSGHGFVSNGNQFLVGSDASPGDRIPYSSVAQTTVIDLLSTASYFVGLFDVCRFDLSRDQDSQLLGLAELDRREGEITNAAPFSHPSVASQTLISNPNSEVLDDRPNWILSFANARGLAVAQYLDIDDHLSPYTRTLLDYLGGADSITQELEAIRSAMVRSGTGHNPEYLSAIEGSLFLDADMALNERQAASWKQIKDGTELHKLIEFRSRYLNGPYSHLALTKMKDLIRHERAKNRIQASR